MTFTHVLISRPRGESIELAAMLEPLGLKAVIQPAFSFLSQDARSLQPEVFSEMETAGADSLLVFTSPRSVAHGIPQLPEGLLFRARVAAIGPATARALAEIGVRVNVVPAQGFTSEALLECLSGQLVGGGSTASFAFMMAAPGGRKKLKEGLTGLGWKTRLVKVYKPEPSALDKAALAALQDASGVLCIWTSGNAMKALSQRLPPATWFQLCQGDWLVISERLKRLARAYGPARIHLASGPGNADLLSSIRALV
jgi:uroporphyrinogen-III synthase